MHTFIVMVVGYWGRGNSLPEAARNCKANGCRVSERAAAWIITGDDKASVNDRGYIERAPNSENIMIGNNFKLGQLLKSQVSPNF